MKKLMIGFLLSVFLVGKQETFADSFLTVEAVRCDFLPGLHADWQSGNPEMTKGEFGGSIVFDSINLNNGTARMIGNAGMPELSVLSSSDGMTFIEWIDGDTVVVTTIFQQHPKADRSRYTAVHSRHRISGSQQYHGTCKEF